MLLLYRCFLFLSACLFSITGVLSLVELDDNSFEKTVTFDGDTDLWIVDFYAPWCQHCKLLEPELEKLEVIIQESHIDGIQIAKVDGTDATAIASQLSVKHYPTIFFIHRGKYHVYSGFRTAEDILQFADRLRSDAKVISIHSELELEPLFERHELVFLLAYASSDNSPNRPEIESQFLQVADDLKLSCSFAVMEVNSVPSDDRTPPSVLKKMESNRTALILNITSSTTALDIVDFTERHNHLLLTPLDKTNFKRLGRTGKPMIIAITNPFRDEEGSEALVDLLDDAVTDIEEADHIDTETLHNFIFGHMDGLKYRMFLSRYRATPLSLLVIDLLNDHTPGEAGGGGYYVTYDVSAESVHSVVEKAIRGDLNYREIMSFDLTFFDRIKKKIYDYYPMSLLCLLPLVMVVLSTLVPKPDDKWKKD